MTNSATSSSPLLKRIDRLLLRHHRYVQSSDEVYFISEYTNGKLADHSATNRIILNYKKEMKWRGHASWSYKEPSIKQVADLFRFSILQTTGFSARMSRALLVPIPPHAIKQDPEHDDRNLKMLHYLYPNGKIHELIVQKQSRPPLHQLKERKTPQELGENYLIMPPTFEFEEIWLFDDVLREGTHFRAASNVLCRKYPNKPIIGFFIARSVAEP